MFRRSSLILISFVSAGLIVLFGLMAWAASAATTLNYIHVGNRRLGVGSSVAFGMNITFAGTEFTCHRYFEDEARKYRRYRRTFGPVEASISPCYCRTTPRGIETASATTTFSSYPHAYCERAELKLQSKSRFYVLGAAIVVGFWPVITLRDLVRRRRDFDHCRNCRYDVRGNTSGVCPECGTKLLRPPSPIAE